MNLNIKHVVVVCMVLVGFACHHKKVEMPNVIIIVADDQGYADMSHLGIHSNIRTPNLDQLAKDGVSFSNAYVTSPICSPSRCGLMTGQYPARNNNYFFGDPGIGQGTKTIAQGFKNKGYTTAYFGKLHYGNSDDPAFYSYPTNHGFDECITAGHGGRVHYLYHNEKAVKKHSKTAQPWLKNGEKFEQDGFTTEQISAWSQAFIEQNKDKPFFLQIAFNAVHNFNFQLPEKYLKEWDLPYYPDYEELGDTIKESKWYDQSILPNLPNGRAYYIAQLYYLDREIGAIREKLKALGLDENTIIVYTSDNGGSNCNGGSNIPLNGTKYSLYEGGIRVPMLMVWKNKLAENTLCDYTVSTLDLMPTLLSAAKANKSDYENSDGIDLLPCLLNNEGIKRDVLVWDVGFAWAVRKGKWKLKVIKDQKKADKISRKQHTYLGKGVELFDLEMDKSEQNNVAERHPEQVRELTIAYEDWKNMVIE